MKLISKIMIAAAFVAAINLTVQANSFTPDPKQDTSKMSKKKMDKMSSKDKMSKDKMSKDKMDKKMDTKMDKMSSGKM